MAPKKRKPAVFASEGVDAGTIFNPAPQRRAASGSASLTHQHVAYGPSGNVESEYTINIGENSSSVIDTMISSAGFDQGHEEGISAEWQDQWQWMLEEPESGTTEEDNVERIYEEDCQMEIHGLKNLTLDDSPSTDSARAKTKRQRTQADHPLLLWIPAILQYLDHILRLEGHGTLNSDVEDAICQGNGCAARILRPDSPSYRCIDCFGDRLLCSKCMIATHAYAPLHRIKRWNGHFYEKTSLCEIGLRVQLNHPPGEDCDIPVVGRHDDKFVIIDCDGIHEVALDYCGCHKATPYVDQLLKFRLFPATNLQPKTAATFRVLETFQMLSFTSKVTAYEFYRAIHRRTDNTGQEKVPERYHAFLRMIREWRHLRMLKRGGRGHTKVPRKGDCAVLCPACPYPGINMPLDYEKEMGMRCWLAALFLAIDANFRLKRMNVSNYLKDPSLNHGYAYMVENGGFHNHLTKFGESIPNDKSTCNNHDAIKSANMRGSQGTEASGAGTIECSRHDMKRPNGVGDLQKGERYINMDYFLLSSLEHPIPRRLVISYDIACQWSKNLEPRAVTYGLNALTHLELNDDGEEEVVFRDDLDIIFLVPKFHLPAHVDACQKKYSFNFQPKVGRTDGEAPERGWADMNGVASSTKEMGPGSRRDTLDDHFGDYNWAKIAQIGKTFLKKSIEALEMRQVHVAEFLAFSRSYPKVAVRRWTEMCLLWEADQSNPNPFDAPKSTVTLAEVRRQLAEEEEQALKDGTAESRLVAHDVSPATLIYQGLEIEEIQSRLKIDAGKLTSGSTSLQRAQILERSNSLHRRIDAWIEIQHLYCPAVSVLRNDLDATVDSVPVAAHSINLCLPSEVPDIPYSDELIRAEWALRTADAEGALVDIRTQILLRSQLWRSKGKHSRGQRSQTRSMTVINGVQARIDRLFTRYNRSQQAMTALEPRLRSEMAESVKGWEKKLRPMKKTDCTGLTSETFGPGEGRKLLSWIWKSNPEDDEEKEVESEGAEVDEDKDLSPETEPALRVEWARSRARAHRWQEEALLLEEEMRRVLAFFQWKSDQWVEFGATVAKEEEEQAIQRQDADGQDFPMHSTKAEETKRQILAGKIAYAHQQSAVYLGLRDGCIRQWEGLKDKLLTFNGKDANIMVEYI